MFLPLCQRGLLVVKCWNSNITTWVNYSNLYLNFINFIQIWYVICSSRKLSFGWCWLCSCTEENNDFRGEDLEAVACKPIRNTLRFAGLLWEGETEDGNIIAVWNDLHGLWTLSSFVEFFTKLNNWNKFRTFRQRELHIRSDKGPVIINSRCGTEEKLSWHKKTSYSTFHSSRFFSLTQLMSISFFDPPHQIWLQKIDKMLNKWVFLFKVFLTVNFIDADEIIPSSFLPNPHGYSFFS
jgi:hypothetical protein